MEIQFLLMNSNHYSLRDFNHFASNLMFSINAALLSYLSTGVRPVLLTMIDVCLNEQHLFIPLSKGCYSKLAVGVLIECIRCQVMYSKFMG